MYQNLKQKQLSGRGGGYYLLVLMCNKFIGTLA